MKREHCLACGGIALRQFLDLGNQPNGNAFLYARELAQEVCLPLSMLVCEECWQVQLSEFPSADSMFLDHPYISGINLAVAQHFRRLALHVVNKLQLKQNDLVLDIGCNDGSLLACFELAGMRTLGIDPNRRTAELAKSKGITVFRQFWNEEAGQCLKYLGVRPAVITATAVFYHVPDLHNFVVGLTHIMDTESCFIMQGVSLRELIKNNQFDHFYHEHICIHSLAPLIRLFQAHGLRVQDVEESPIHGGSFILYVRRNESDIPSTKAVALALEADDHAGLNLRSTYDLFATRVKDNRKTLITLLRRLRLENRSVYALGAPVKGSTLLNYCGIGPDLVSCAAEINPFKIGRVTPGTHIPVVDERLIRFPPDYYLVLSWNFTDHLRAKFADYLNSGGRFILHTPNIAILGSAQEVGTTCAE